MKTKILLLGASGRTGRLILERALEKGYEVNCLLRNSARIEGRIGTTIFEGNPNNPSDLESALAGCQHVICTLSISRTSDFPWAKLRTPKNYLSDVAGVLISIAIKRNLNRIVICSAWGVAETKSSVPKWFKWLIAYSNIGMAYKDHERQEQLISDSKLNWTIVRPVGLTNSKREEKIKITIENKPRPSLTISRRNVAEFILSCIANNDLIRKKVTISTAKDRTIIGPAHSNFANV